MNGFSAKMGAAVAIAAMALAVSGCSRVRGHQGFIADSALIDSIKAGVDNQDSVSKTLGRPTFVGQFNPNDWYYVSRTTKQLAFASPSPVDQLVLRVRFDGTGNVIAVDRAGMDKIAKVSPNGKSTPTLGRERSLLEDLFGNIGQVGAGGGGDGGSADNPN